MHRCAVSIEETNRRRSSATSRICRRREDSADVRRWVAEFISASFVELKGLETVGRFRLLDFSLTKVKKTNIMKKNQIVKESLIK